MSKIIEAQAPPAALTATYMAKGAFTDCYYVDMQQKILLSQYIEAFYTTPLFKLERAILTLIARRPATDTDAAALSLGSAIIYSAWEVESRDVDQILLRDFTGQTRSWLMVQCSSASGDTATRLFFGSVVVPKKVAENGEGSFGLVFSLLGGFHRIYSRMLLKAAYNKLLRNSIN